MSCSKRLLSVGIFSIVIGFVSNRFGSYTMKLYDENLDEDYKNISIALFSIGVVFIFYGILNIVWNGKKPMCNLSYI